MTCLAIVLNLKPFPRVHEKLQHLEVREFTTLSRFLKIFSAFSSMSLVNFSK